METQQKRSDLEETSQQVSSRKGGLRTMPFVIANEAFEKVASFGLHANMIFYLINEYHLDYATGASVLLVWGAVSNFLPSFGAFLSDAYLGRFYVIGLGSIMTLLGLFVLWLTALIDSARPPHCETYPINCVKPKAGQLVFLFSSFVLMSIGTGGVRPCSLAFGADQFDNPENPKNQRVLQSFFNWYYASVGISIMFSITVIVYIQNSAGWVIGFGVPVGLMLFSTVMYFLGSKLYVKVKAHKSLISSLARVIVVAWKNRHLTLPTNDGHDKYYHEKDSKFVSPTQKLRFLNKACLIRDPDKDLKPNGSASEPRNVCTARQVEELKALIKVLPIWSTSISIAVVMNQSFGVLQARTMDRTLAGDFKIPPGSFPAFALLALTLWVVVYDRIIVPRLSKITQNPRGLSVQQRIGIGLVICCSATAVAAVVERTRRARAISEGLAEKPLAVVSMSAMWLVPQYSLAGLAEAFNAIGQIELYYSQFPKSMSSIGVSLFALGMAVGNMVGVVIVVIIKHRSRRGNRVSWLSDNLNKGHYDYYYWVLTILSVANVFYYIMCTKLFGCSEDQKIWDEIEATKEEDIIKSKESPIVFTL